MAAPEYEFEFEEEFEEEEENSVLSRIPSI
jgi:hypothetical protein